MEKDFLKISESESDFEKKIEKRIYLWYNLFSKII